MARRCFILLLSLSMLVLPATSWADGIPILGRVLGADGEGLAKAEVHLEPIPSTYERAMLRHDGHAGAEPVAETRTAADGTFELTAPEAGMWKVVVASRGKLTMESRLVPLVRETVLPELKLEPKTELEVRVQSVEGEPLTAAVGVVTRRVRSAWRPQLRLAEAGADGKASLPVGRSELLQLEVLADGRPLVVSEPSAKRSVTVEVPAGVPATVRVIDAKKRPVADALAFQGSALLPLGVSDAEGLLTLALAAEEPLKLEVTTLERWHGTFDLRAGDAKTRDLRLEPPTLVRGRVLDLASRDAIGEALVWAVRGEYVVTDGQGAFELPIGIYESRWVQAAGGGYLKGFSELGKGADLDSIAIALTPAAALSGKVVDESGALLAGVRVELQPMPADRMSGASRRLAREGWRGRTSQRGVFRVAGLPADMAYRLTFRAEGYAPETLTVEPLSASERREELRVELRRGYLAFGYVVDEHEAPVAGARVSLRPPPPGGDLRSAMRMMRRPGSDSDLPTTATDAEGRFEIPDLAGGRYDLEVRAGGFAPAKIPGVQVVEDARVDLGTVVMVPGVALEGRVVDADGEGIEGAQVRLEQARGAFGRMTGQQPGSTSTDARGRFVISDLQPGQPVTVSAAREGYSSAVVSDIAPPLEEPLTVVLELAAQLSGRIFDGQGEPIQGARITAHPDFRAMAGRRTGMRVNDWASGETDAGGRYRLDSVEPGMLRVTAHAEGYKEKVREGLEAAAGGKLEVDFVLEVGAVVEGTVTTADGEPVIQATVRIAEPRGELAFSHQSSAHAQTDAEGRYRATGAVVGLATLTIYDGRQERLSKSVEIRPGTNVFDLVLERGFEITGQVVSPEGEPVGGAAVTVQANSRPGVGHFAFGQANATSGFDGSFTLTGIKPGNYTVGASFEGYGPAHSELLEVQADVSGLLLQLSTGATLKGQVIGLELDELSSLELIAFSAEGGLLRGHVDFEGTYRFENLASGEWYVQAKVTSSQRSSSLKVELPEGVPEVVKDIEFGSGFTLTGIVLDNGEPVAGASISASSTQAGSGHTMTGNDGRFRIENLQAGAYQVLAMVGMGFREAQMIELSGDHDMRIEVSTGNVRGVVHSADGEPLSGVVVVMKLEGDSDRSRQLNFGNHAQTDSQGSFSVLHVKQGTWRVTATKPGYAPAETLVVVGAEAAPAVEITLNPAEGVSFEFALESGAVLPTAQVAVLNASGRQLSTGSFPVVDGQLRVSIVPRGQWELVVQAGDSAATRVLVNAPGEQGRVVLPPGGALHIKVPELEDDLTPTRVRLTGPDGRPYVGLGYVLMLAAGEWMMAAGQSLVPQLTPGPWTFSIQHSDGRSWSGSANVVAGTVTEVTVP
ncbi:MAG: carboxypeptidase-like regulatory domain-containing protein [Acidobacteriota bacterium]